MNGRQILVTLILSMLFISSTGLVTETQPHWEVEVGERFDFRLQYVRCDRSLDPSERVMTFDEQVYMEITGLANLSKPFWLVPVYSVCDCQNIIAFPNGTDLYSTSHMYSVKMDTPFTAAMAIGNWTGANAVILELDAQYSSSGLTLEVIENSTTWGYIYHDSNINMTDTRIWSKDDGSLLQVDIRNGINERFESIDEAIDLLLDRLYLSQTIDLVIVSGSIVIAAVVIGLVVLVKKRLS